MSLLMQTIQQNPFKWGVNLETAKMLITSFYKQNVLKRKRELVKSSDLDAIMDKIANHMTNPKKPGIILMGGVGCGKSTMLYALQGAHNYLYPHYKDIGIVIKDASTIIEQVQKQEHTLDYKTMPDMMAIDDLGKEPTEIMVYGSIVQPIVELFECRYNAQLPMMITTNLEKRQVAEKYGRRIADRFNEFFEVIEFTKCSYRRLKV